MAIFYTLLFLFLSSMAANASQLLSDQNAKDSYYLETVTAQSKQSVYSLVTAPSINKKKIDLLYGKIRSSMPSAEIRKNIEERVIYRLVAQCFDNISPARRLQSELLKYSQAAFIIPMDDSYCAAASSHTTEKAALAEQKRLAGKNINVKMVKLSLQLPHWRVKSGDFQRLRDAVYEANRISTQGVITIIEPFDDKADITYEARN